MALFLLLFVSLLVLLFAVIHVSWFTKRPAGCMCIIEGQALEVMCICVVGEDGPTHLCTPCATCFTGMPWD